MLPLALGMVGNLAKERPLDPTMWRKLHTKFLELERGKLLQVLFQVIDTSVDDLPSTQQAQLQLMAVMASGVVATPEMLANLWDQVCTFLHMLLVAL